MPDEIEAPFEVRKNCPKIEIALGYLKFNPANVSTIARAYCDSLKKTAPRKGQLTSVMDMGGMDVDESIIFVYLHSGRYDVPFMVYFHEPLLQPNPDLKSLKV